jgi:protein-disulfide isomerase
MKNIQYFILIAFICTACQKDKHEQTLEVKNFFLPTETQVLQVLNSKEDYRMLDDHAKAKGYKNAKEYHAKFANEVTDNDLQIYYNKYKPSGMENLGVEAIANERKKILNRIAWYRIIQEVNLNVELRGLEFSKVDWKKIPLDDEPSIGNQFAKITVIEFSDFECHYCSKSQAVSSELREKYKKQIYWVFKDFPLQEIHEDAFQAHISANCVKEIQPEKYWIYFRTLFENYRSLEKENLTAYIKESEIDQDKWKACMENPQMRKKITYEIQADIKEGKNLGIKGTPTFIINGNLIVGARGYEFFDAVIQKEIKAAN